MPYRHCAAPSSVLIFLICLLMLLAGAHVRAREAGAGLALSYPGYPELAAAVRLRLRLDDKTGASPALGAIAREQTIGRTGGHARALALADWVRMHVRRTGSRLDLAGPPPRPAAAVLESRSGTVDELVVLLRALLAESGIDATPALLRRDAADTLPELAMPAAFDHMLLYLPGLDLYLDPSAEGIAAGYLAPALLGKPVLLASGGFAMTPMMQPQRVSMKATVAIQRDGRGAVTLDRSYTGALADPFRKAAGEALPARAQFLAHMLPVAAPQSRKVLMLDTLHPELSTVADAMAGLPWESRDSRGAACPAIDATDEIRYQLPVAMKILAVPAPVSVIRGGMFYRAIYARQGNTVLVKRSLSFRNGRPRCTPAEIRALLPALERVAMDLRSQIRLATR